MWSMINAIMFTGISSRSYLQWRKLVKKDLGTTFSQNGSQTPPSNRGSRSVSLGKSSQPSVFARYNYLLQWRIQNDFEGGGSSLEKGRL